MDTSTVLQVVLSNLLPLIIAIVTPIALVLVKKSVVYLEKRFDFDVKEADEKKLGTLVVEGIHFAEEWARKQAKTGTLPASGLKLNKALGYVIDGIKEQNLDSRTADWLSQKLEATLSLAMANGGIGPDPKHAMITDLENEPGKPSGSSHR